MEKRKIRQRRILSKEKRKAFLKEKRKEWRKKEKELRNLRNPEEIWRRINREERRNGEITI